MSSIQKPEKAPGESISLLCYSRGEIIRLSINDMKESKSFSLFPHTRNFQALAKFGIYIGWSEKNETQIKCF